jgi:hypothetical protein
MDINYEMISNEVIFVFVSRQMMILHLFSVSVKGWVFLIKIHIFYISVKG